MIEPRTEGHEGRNDAPRKSHQNPCDSNQELSQESNNDALEQKRDYIEFLFFRTWVLIMGKAPE